MRALNICECSISEDVPVNFIPGLEEIAVEGTHGMPSLRSNALRNGITSLASHIDACVGTGIGTDACDFDEGDRMIEDTIPTRPPEIVIKTKLPSPIWKKVMSSMT